MDLLGETWAYVAENSDRFQQAVLVHLGLSFGALAIAMLIFIPLGVLSSFGGKLTSTIIGAVAAVRVIPSLAVILLLLPFFGLGWKPALIALTLLAGPPLVINTDTGLRGVEAATLEAATGLGMTGAQRFWRVKMPLALPVMVTGIRSAAVEVIAQCHPGGVCRRWWARHVHYLGHHAHGRAHAPRRRHFGNLAGIGDGVDAGATGGSHFAAGHDSGLSEAVCQTGICHHRMYRTPVRVLHCRTPLPRWHGSGHTAREGAH